MQVPRINIIIIINNNNDNNNNNDKDNDNDNANDNDNDNDNNIQKDTKPPTRFWHQTSNTCKIKNPHINFTP